MIVIRALFTIAFLLTSITIMRAQVHHGPRATQELFDKLYRLDSILFNAAFVSCDFEVLRSLVTDDLEFYHDKDGLSVTSAEEFVDGARETCEGRITGRNLKVRRELVGGSLEVYPLNNYGAIQIGVHRFYIIQDDGSESLAEVAKFTHVWKEDEGNWRISRVLSYDHQPPTDH